MIKSVFYLIVFICFFSVFKTNAQKTTAIPNAVWSDPDSWSPTGVPGTSDAVTVAAGHSLTIDQSDSCASLTFNYDATSGNHLTLTNSSDTLVVTGTIQFDEVDQMFDEIAVTINGTLIANRLTFNGDTEFGAQTFTIGNNGKVEVASNTIFDFDDGSSKAPAFTFTNNGEFHIKGGTFLISHECAGDVTFNIEDKMICDANFIMSASVSLDARNTFNLKDTLDANGTIFRLTTNNPADSTKNIFNMANNNAHLLLSGTLSFTGDENGGVINNTSTETSIFELDGSSTQTIYTEDNVEYHHLKINNSAGVNLSSTLGGKNQNKFFGDLIIASGATLNAQATADSVSIDGDFNNAGTFESSGCHVILRGDWINTGSYNPNSGDTVKFNSDDAGETQTISGTDTISILKIDNNSGNKVQNISGTIYISKLIDIVNGILETNDNLTLVANGNNVAMVSNVNAGDIIDSVNVEREFAVGDVSPSYFNLCSPVYGSTLADWKEGGIVMTGFTGSNYPNSNVSVWTYDDHLTNGNSSDGYVAATNITNPIGFVGNTSSDSLIGHHLLISQNSFKITVRGPLVQGDKDVAIQYVDNGTGTDGFNLIGNPYASTIDWDLVWLNSGNNNINPVYYARTPSSGWAYYDADTKAADNATKNIGCMQGFWIQATGSSPTFEFKESNKTASQRKILTKPATKNFLLSQNRKLLKFHLVGDQNDFTSTAAIYTLPNTTVNYEKRDIVKMDEYSKTRPYLAIKTSLINLAVNYFSKDSGDSFSFDVMALAGSNTAGQHTIRITNGNTFFPGACLILEDVELGIMTDLRTNSEYNYQSLATDSTKARFKIHVSKSYNLTLQDVNCYGSNNGFAALSSRSGKKLTNIIWKNENGDILKTVTDTVETDTLKNISNGIYTYSVQNLTCESQFLDTVVIEQPEKIIANFEADHDTTYLSRPNFVRFTNKSSKDMIYSWNFGEGTTSKLENPKHKYKTEGIYTVKLTVHPPGEDHCLQYIEKNIVVLGLHPDDYNCYYTQLVNSTCFDDSTGIVIVKSQKEDFDKIDYKHLNGDLIVSRTNVGSVDSLDGLVGGKYIIEAKVCDVTIMDTVEITSPDPITASFTNDKDTAIVNVPFQFVNTSSSNTKSYLWFFGDGNSSKERSPVHTYTVDSSKVVTVSLIAFDDDSICSNQFNKNINVFLIDDINELADRNGTIKIVKTNVGSFVQFEFDKQTNVYIELFNIQGQKIGDTQNLIASKQLVKLNTSSENIHIVKITTENDMFIHKF